ncbi:MAG: methyltransferase domain-containing protein [Terracidiphilus sp.]
MLSETFYKQSGILFLLLSKMRTRIRGYTSPRPFSVTESQRAAEYDIQVVDQWLRRLEVYRDSELSLNGANVLELGPGADLGTGLYLLSRGAETYTAVDVNNLAMCAPNEIYEKLIELISTSDSCDTTPLRNELQALQDHAECRLRFAHVPDFDIASNVPPGSIDIVFSQAAFEHFSDVERVLRELYVVAKPGAALIAEIDLRTHSRWIRDHDILNIYRYGDRLYHHLSYPGSPNRLRPHEYKGMCERSGWTNVCIEALTTLANRSLARVSSHLAQRFRSDLNQMEQLTILLCATRG